MDWNHDGKIDYKDDAFFHNVAMKDSSKETGTKSSNSRNSSTDSSASSINGLTWFIILCIVYLISKIIGG